jgi:hypothetical protein
METIKTVEFVPTSEKTTFMESLTSMLVDQARQSPSQRFPAGLALLGHFYTPEVLDSIDKDRFWSGLPDLGNDQEERIARICELFPITTFCPDPRTNRRKLYIEILWLRNESIVGWKFDKTTGRVSKNHVAASNILHNTRLNQALDVLQAMSGEISDNTVRSIHPVPRIGRSSK